MDEEFSYLLGSSLHAVATVVAAFLGGLALGARFLGASLARRRRGPPTYALLELGVGLCGIGGPKASRRSSGPWRSTPRTGARG